MLSAQETESVMRKYRSSLIHQEGDKREIGGGRKISQAYDSITRFYIHKVEFSQTCDICFLTGSLSKGRQHLTEVIFTKFCSYDFCFILKHNPHFVLSRMNLNFEISLLQLLSSWNINWITKLLWILLVYSPSSTSSLLQILADRYKAGKCNAHFFATSNFLKC